MNKLFEFTEADESVIIKRREKIETEIEFILRNKINKPIKGKISPGKLRWRAVRNIAYRPNNVFLGIIQRGKLICVDWEVQLTNNVSNNKQSK